MARYGLIIDVEKCNGCYNCFLACKDEHCGIDHMPLAAGQPELGQYWIDVDERERGSYPKVKVASIPITCMQCDDPPCMKAAEDASAAGDASQASPRGAGSADGALYKRADGIVIIDPVKAKGHKEVVDACPHGVIFWNEKASLPQKCTMCAHLLDQGWSEPRCVEACPTGALIFGDLDDPGNEISRIAATAALEELSPESAAIGTVKYVGLPKRFVAGTVYLRDIEEECAEGCEVVLRGPDGELRALTNFFGDFEFEGLAADTRYEVDIAKDGYARQTLSATTAKDVYLGDIYLNLEASP